MFISPLICRFVCFTVLLGATAARATVYDLAVGDAVGRSLRLNVPDTIPVLRGILIWGNGASSDNRGRATDPELAAWAESYGFAVLATAQWGNFWYDAANEIALFETSLSRLAVLSGHAELTVVPWLPIGHSNGGLMSYGFNNLRPAKVISLLLSKAGAYTEARPDVSILRTPGLLVAGDRDDDVRIVAIRDRFFGNRPRGALWSWVEEEGMDHSEGNSAELIRPFIEATMRLRYPMTAVAGTAVQLNPVVERNGWLTDPETYKIGMADIASFGTYAKDRSTAGWLPNRRVAFIFRAFASYHKATATAVLSTGAGPVEWGTAATYTLSAPASAWSTIDFYEGDVWLKRASPGDADSLSVSLQPRLPGYAVFHALVTFADGTQRTTMPRRVLVRAGSLHAPTVVQQPVDQSLRVGHETSFSVVAVSPVYPRYQWQRSTNGGATWNSLVDDLTYAGTTTDTLVVQAPGAEMSGDRFHCVISNGAPPDAVSAAASLTLANLPTILLPPASAVTGAGARIVFSVVASGAGQLSYQWSKNGVALSGATAAELGLNSVTAADAGSYTVSVTNSHGSIVSASAGLTVGSDAYVAPTATLMNISTRAFVGTGDNCLIAGFVVGGSGSKTVLIRVAGPALTSLTNGQLTGVLADPIVQLTRPDGTLLALNDNWDNDSAVTAAAGAAGAFQFGQSSKDSALIATLPPGAYTALVKGVNEATGIALVEVYDLDPTAASRLINLSTRAQVGTGDHVLIAGLVIGGTGQRNVLLRAAGPALGPLTNGQIATFLPDPQLVLKKLDGTSLALNDNWDESNGVAIARAARQTGAFPLAAGTRDSALLVELPAGLYTPTVTEHSGLGGLALVEIYDVD